MPFWYQYVELVYRTSELIWETPTQILTNLIYRVLDGSGVVLELVCENVRKYLKTREDTVK